MRPATRALGASAAAALALVIAAPSHSPSRARADELPAFPPGFLWGAATAAHQVEGGDTGNDWTEWEQACHLPGCEKAGQAVDEYHRYAEDLDLARSIGLGAFRLSIEWSRVEPSDGVFDEAELRHYRNELRAAHARGLKTMLTLQHFTLPLWIAHRGQGGWLDPGIVSSFESFTLRTVQELGAEVDYWLTINEPTVSMLTGYVAGVSPPGLKDIGKAAPVLTHMLKAHAAAYHAIHGAIPGAQVGFAHHVRVFAPFRSWNPLDAALASAVDDFWNHQFVRAIQSGRADFSIPLVIDSSEDIPGLQGTLDFLGVNYYTRDFVRFAPDQPQRFDLPVVPGLPRTDVGWEIYPQGLYDSLKAMAQYGYPLYVTENGVADAQDTMRRQFLCDHLREVARAIADGVDVRGYVHWSLLDNFEWSLGRAPRFGLAAVDYSTLKRTLRPSASVLTETIRAGRLAGCSP